MTDINYEEMNPGIRRTVKWLRSCGFDTTDSGDGVTHDHACDRDHAYVVIVVEDADRLVKRADLLRGLLGHRGIKIAPQSIDPSAQVSIQASYDPANRIAVIDLTGLTDAMLFPEDRGAA